MPSLSPSPEVRRADTLFGRSPMEKDVDVSKVVPFDDGFVFHCKPCSSEFLLPGDSFLPMFTLDLDFLFLSIPGNSGP